MKLLAVLLGLIGAIALLFAILFAQMAFDTSGVESERAFLRDFQQTEKFVNAYQAQKGRLPSNDDLMGWIRAADIDSSHFFSIKRTPIHICDDERIRFESATGDRFVLFVWRGEMEECYASPSGRTSLLLSESAWLKNNLTSSGPVILVLLAFSAALFYGAFQLFSWRRKTHAASNS